MGIWGIKHVFKYILPENDHPIEYSAKLYLTDTFLDLNFSKVFFFGGRLGLNYHIWVYVAQNTFFENLVLK